MSPHDQSFATDKTEVVRQETAQAFIMQDSDPVAIPTEGSDFVQMEQPNAADEESKVSTSICSEQIIPLREESN